MHYAQLLEMVLGTEIWHSSDAKMLLTIAKLDKSCNRLVRDCNGGGLVRTLVFDELDDQQASRALDSFRRWLLRYSGLLGSLHICDAQDRHPRGTCDLDHILAGTLAELQQLPLHRFETHLRPCGETIIALSALTALTSLRLASLEFNEDFDAVPALLQRLTGLKALALEPGPAELGLCRCMPLSSS